MKPVEWIGSSHKDYCRFPTPVLAQMGFALYRAQLGYLHQSAKPLKGFGGADVVEIVNSDPAGTYRAIYTVRFAEVIYVLHAFQKKSKTGIETPKGEISLIKSRLKRAEEEHAAWLARRKGTKEHG